MFKLFCRNDRIASFCAEKLNIWKKIAKERRNPALATWQGRPARSGPAGRHLSSRPGLGRPTRLNQATAQARARARPGTNFKKTNLRPSVPGRLILVEGPDRRHTNPRPHLSEAIRGTRSRTPSGDATEPLMLRWLANRRYPRVGCPRWGRPPP